MRTRRASFDCRADTGRIRISDGAGYASSAAVSSQPFDARMVAGTDLRLSTRFFARRLLGTRQCLRS